LKLEYKFVPGRTNRLERKDDFRSFAIGIGRLAQQNDGITTQHVFHTSNSTRRENHRKGRSHGEDLKSKSEGSRVARKREANERYCGARES
jgi:hypothetical protein